MATGFLSEQLMTPRTNIAAQSPALVREPLLGSQALLTEVASYNTTAKTFEDKVTVALGIAEIVRNTLNQYEPRQKRDILSPEIIAGNERANCFGQTIVFSECLEQAGIEHFVAFANGHAFILLGDREKQRYYNIDPMAHKLNGDASQLISGVNIFDQFDTGKKLANVRFNASRLLHQRGLMADVGRIAISNEWLNHDTSAVSLPSSPPLDSQLLYLQVMPPELGRDTLLHYANAITHINAGDDRAAIDEIKLLSTYPDVDPRNKLLAAQNARTLAFRHKHWGSALAIAEFIEANRDDLPFLHARYFKPETLRKVGVSTGIGQLLDDAATAYARVNPGSRITKGKIRKTLELKDQLPEVAPEA